MTDRFYFLMLHSSSFGKPKTTTNIHYFSIDETLVYSRSLLLLLLVLVCVLSEQGCLLNALARVFISESCIVGLLMGCCYDEVADMLTFANVRSALLK